MGETAEIITEEEAAAMNRDVVPHHTVGQVSIYRSADPEAQLTEARSRAKVLVEVVQEQNLAQSFGSGRKPHVNVEGWTFLASQFGLIPDIEWTREIEGGIGWEARAQLIRLADGKVITHAESECRRDETKGGKQRWKNANSYEIRSMAQTRATSKVCRNALSSIMVLAGFAGTPAEEMDGSSGGTVSPPASQQDPHCPACLAINGELVAVSGPHDKKPFWRCVNKGEKCAGSREHNNKTYSWSGWHKTFEASRDEWFENNPEHAGPQTKEVGERANYSGWIIDEIVSTLNIEEDDAKSLVKPALTYAISERRFDPAEALGESVDLEKMTADQLRTVATNLSAEEAQIVVTAACELGQEEDTDAGDD